MNAITTRTAGGALAALNSLKAGLQNVQSTIISRGGDPYLRLGRDGGWIYGQESIEVEKGSEWACNPLSIEHGWVCWDRSKDGDTSNGPLGEIMVGAGQPLPDKASLKDHGHEWVQQLAINLRCLTGEDKDEQVEYKTNSAGGVSALQGLIKAISQQVDKDTTAVVPVINLETDHYNHKKYGKTYTPELTIVRWIEMDGAAPADDEQADEPETVQPEPAKPTRTRKASVPKVKQTATVDDELEKLEAMIAAKKAAKDAAAKTEAPVDPAAAKRAALLAQLAELEGDAGDTGTEEPAAEAPAAGAPLRRRRA